MLGCSVMTLCDPMDCSLQAPLSMEFSRQDYWSRLPFHTPGDLPNPETEPMSFMAPALAVRFLPLAPHGKLIKKVWLYKILTSEKYYKSGFIVITFTAL